MAKNMKRWERGKPRFSSLLHWYRLEIGIDGGKVDAFDFCGGFSDVDGSAQHG